ncbi:MAG: metal ABC transporter permease [Pelotomaculaceae bacterium]|uniref:ABC-type Mn2+/Zn2+ transport systems, permease components n=1 Tax=anaerobic digester metagenome TaxID=1263854 RepID=A0A485M861_9ZZZZ|nr:metal ABC transporter permease [Bacillota bacterium]HHU87438.1 metal ABC transporter permease [Peptococcaceae bacterium]
MEIFHYGYMNRAILMGIVVGITCPVIGLFIVLRRMSLIADALSHISLAGVAAGLLTGAHPVLSASLFSVCGAFLIEKLRENYRTYSELSIAIILSSGLALAAVLLSLGKGFNTSILSYLFGSIILIDDKDFRLIAWIGLATLGLIALFFKELYFITLDEDAAASAGVSVRAISMGFTVLTAMVIAISMRVVGILLVSSLMILPVAGALQLARSFKEALFLSTGLSLISVLIGIFASFYLNLSPGGTIILFSVWVLLLILAGKKAAASLQRRKSADKTRVRNTSV